METPHPHSQVYWPRHNVHIPFWPSPNFAFVSVMKKQVGQCLRKHRVLEWTTRLQIYFKPGADYTEVRSLQNWRKDWGDYCQRICVLFSRMLLRQQKHSTRCGINHHRRRNSLWCSDSIVRPSKASRKDALSCVRVHAKRRIRPWYSAARKGICCVVCWCCFSSRNYHWNLNQETMKQWNLMTQWMADLDIADLV